MIALTLAMRDWRAIVDTCHMTVGKADMRVAGLYARLVADEALRDRMLAKVTSEFDRTCAAILQVVDRERILDDKPFLQTSIRLRNPPRPLYHERGYTSVRTLPPPAARRRRHRHAIAAAGTRTRLLW